MALAPDTDSMINDALPVQYLSRGDLLHDGCAAYTWAGRRWELVTDHRHDKSIDARGSIRRKSAST